ncbi:hypothetical protein C8J56DRAFT_395090 [Mycena floridula]|nr:hypothetical protein C8J56DRAFT_395090 [Mycena floridula]
MKTSFTAIISIVPFLLAGQVAAICPGFNFGIGNAMDLGGGIKRWDVYDDSCKVVDSLTTNENPCDQGTFSCSPPPIHFTGYKSTFTGLRYACRADPNSGKCGGDTISVCCRNDGN